MRSFKFLIDAEGGLSPWPYSSLRIALRCASDTHTFVTYAVTNLGFIHVTERQHGLAVSLRPGVVCPRALVSAIHLLSDLPHQRIVLSALSDAWNHRVFRSPTELVLKLIDELRFREAGQSDFLHRAQAIDDIREDTAFANLMRAWTDAGAVFDGEQFNAVTHRILNGRFALLTPQPDGNTLTIEDWGHAYASFDTRWLAMSRGLRFEDQPDYRYACAAVGAYHEVMRRGEPLLDEVDAIISHPRFGRRRIQYRRLILPVRAPTGQTRLLSTSLTDPGVDLRFRRRHEG